MGDGGSSVATGCETNWATVLTSSFSEDVVRSRVAGIRVAGDHSCISWYEPGCGYPMGTGLIPVVVELGPDTGSPFDGPSLSSVGTGSPLKDLRLR